MKTDRFFSEVNEQENEEKITLQTLCVYIKQIKFIIHFFEGISHLSSNIFAGDVRYDLFI